MAIVILYSTGTGTETTSPSLRSSVDLIDCLLMYFIFRFFISDCCVSIIGNVSVSSGEIGVKLCWNTFVSAEKTPTSKC